MVLASDDSVVIRNIDTPVIVNSITNNVFDNRAVVHQNEKIVRELKYYYDTSGVKYTLDDPDLSDVSLTSDLDGERVALLPSEDCGDEPDDSYSISFVVDRNIEHQSTKSQNKILRKIESAFNKFRNKLSEIRKNRYPSPLTTGSASLVFDSDEDVAVNTPATTNVPSHASITDEDVVYNAEECDDSYASDNEVIGDMIREFENLSPCKALAEADEKAETLEALQVQTALICNNECDSDIIEDGTPPTESNAPIERPKYVRPEINDADNLRRIGTTASKYIPELDIESGMFGAPFARLPVVFKDEHPGDVIVLPTAKALKDRIAACSAGGWKLLNNDKLVCSDYSAKFEYHYLESSQYFDYFEVNDIGALTESILSKESRLTTYANPVNRTIISESAFTDLLAEITLKDAPLVAAKRLSQKYRNQNGDASEHVIVEALTQMALGYMAKRCDAVKLVLDQYDATIPSVERAVLLNIAIRGTCCGVKLVEQDEEAMVDEPSTTACDDDAAPIMGNALSDCNYKKCKLNTQCEHSAYTAITNRITRKVPAMEKDKLEDVSKFLDYISPWLFPCGPIQELDSIEKWQAHMTGSKKAQVNEVLAKMRDVARLEHKITAINSFIKREVFFKKDFTPRLVSATDPMINVITGPPIYTMEKVIKKSWCYYQRDEDVPNNINVTYGAAMDRTKIGGWMDHVTSNFSNPWFVETDYTKFDAHINQDLLSLEVQVYKYLTQNMPHVDWDDLLCVQYQTHGTCNWANKSLRLNLGKYIQLILKKWGNQIAQIPSKVLDWIEVKFGLERNLLRTFRYVTDINALLHNEKGNKTDEKGRIRFRYIGRRHSGAVNTSIGNVIINVVAQLYCLHQQFDIIKHADLWRMIACGDDTVIAFNNCHIDLVKYNKDLLSLGLVTKISTPVLSDVEFCSSYFIPCRIDGRVTYNCTQIPTRNMSKAYVTTVMNLSDLQKAAWVKQNAQAYKANFNHIPFMRKWHSLKFAHFKQLPAMKAKGMDKIRFERSWLSSGTTPGICPESYQWLNDHYDLQDVDLKKLDRMFSKRRINWDDDLIEHMYWCDENKRQSKLIGRLLDDADYNYKKYNPKIAPGIVPEEMVHDFPIIPNEPEDEAIGKITGIKCESTQHNWVDKIRTADCSITKIDPNKTRLKPPLPRHITRGFRLDHFTKNQPLPFNLQKMVNKSMSRTHRLNKQKRDTKIKKAIADEKISYKDVCDPEKPIVGGNHTSKKRLNTRHSKAVYSTSDCVPIS
jgi:hypothetical protein